MANTIYATFASEHAAERAAGALMDHGVSSADISYVISEGPQTNPNTPNFSVHPIVVDAEAPVHTDLPGTVSTVHLPEPPPLPPLHLQRSEPRVLSTPEDQEAGYHYDALGAVIPDSAAPTQPHHAADIATLAGNVSEDTAQHESRAHIIDMHRKLPEAVGGVSTTTSADAAKGSLEGATIGVGLGVLLGLATVLIPGVGLVAGTGALVAGLAAATGAAGGIAGGVYGYLADLGIPSDRARLLSSHLDTGGLILSINVTGRVSEAEIVQVLEKYGATSAQGY